VLRGTAKHLMRLAAVSALAGVAVISAGSAAAAADPVTGTVTAGNLSTKVANEKATSGEKTTIVTPLTLTTNTGGKKSKTPVYCVAFTADLGNGTYTEGPAEGSGVKNYDDISWVLNHSYPAVDADVVLSKVGATVPSSTGGYEQFDSAEFLVYVGTQAAVWELSNPGKFKLGHTYSSTLNVNEAQYNVILKVHDYLADLADSTPHPKLTITPDTATGTVGTNVGPFTVHSGKAEVTLTVTGGKIVDKDGNEVTTLKSNGQFWVTSDTVGTAKVHGSATFEVPAGHLYFTTVDGKKGQTVIAPGKGTKTSEADVTATFTAVPPSPSPSPTSPGLPVTGANVTGAAVGGAVLLLAGIGLVLVLRRRRVKFTA
jgi:LPXTG-motif cell wall-anchored protein